MLRVMLLSTALFMLTAAAPAVDKEHMTELEKRFNSVKSKIMSSKELRGDAHILGSLNEIASKFERASKPKAEKAAVKSVRKIAKAAEKAAKESGQELVKKLQKLSTESQKHTAASVKKASEVKKASGVSLERDQGQEEETEDEDELTEPTPATADEEEEEEKPADLERVESRWKAIKHKILADSELSADPRIVAHMRKIEQKLVSMEKDDGLASEALPDASPDAQADASPEALPDASPEAKPDAKNDDLEKLQGKFESIQSKIMANKELSGDKAIQQKLKNIAAKFERATHAEGEKEGKAAAPSMERAGLEKLQGKFESIQSKIMANKELSGDKAIQQKLKNIAAKFERATHAEEEKEGKAVEKAVEEPSMEREAVEKLQGKFESIQSKIMANKELSGDNLIQQKLKNIASRFERVTGKDAAKKAKAKVAVKDPPKSPKSAPQSGAKPSSTKPKSKAKVAEEDEDEDEDDEEDRRLERLEKRFEAIKGKLMGVKSFRSEPRIQKQLHKIEQEFERAKAGLEADDHAMQPVELA